jgi:hypothetical protein
MVDRSVPTLDTTSEALLSRHEAWWQRQGMLYAEPPVTPLSRLWLPLTDGTVATEDLDLTPDQVDIDRIVGEHLPDGPVETVGDQFRRSAPYTQIPWVEAILGLPIRTTIKGGSMRVRAHIPDWSTWESGTVRRNDEWFDLLKRLVSLLAERRGGRHAITQTLMRGPSDLAEAVLGPELMCFSMYDHPNRLRRFLEQATELFIEVLHEQLARIPAIEKGYVCPFGIWSPGTVVRTQCDASAFLSADHYAEWFMPYDVRICESVEFSIIHLHSNSLHTVDKLLELARPFAIQVTLDIQPSGPPVVQVLPVLRRILSVKPLILEGFLTDEEMRMVSGELPADGLSVTRRTATY